MLVIGLCNRLLERVRRHRVTCGPRSTRTTYLRIEGSSAAPTISRNSTSTSAAAGSFGIQVARRWARVGRRCASPKLVLSGDRPARCDGLMARSLVSRRCRTSRKCEWCRPCKHVGGCKGLDGADAGRTSLDPGLLRRHRLGGTDLRLRWSSEPWPSLDCGPNLGRQPWIKRHKGQDKRRTAADVMTTTEVPLFLAPPRRRLRMICCLRRVPR